MEQTVASERQFAFLTVTELVILIGTILSMWIIGYVHWGPGLVLLSLIGLLSWYSYDKRVTVDPPTFARITVWNTLVPRVIIRPRIVFAFKYFPFFEELIVVDESPVVKSAEDKAELIFKDVRCKAESDQVDPTKIESGGSVEVHVGLAFFADSSRSRDFIRKGKTDQVTKMLVTKLGASIRHQGATVTWTEYAFRKASLSMQLIIDLTGFQPTEKVVRAADGTTPIPDLDKTRPHHKYLVRERTVDDVLDEIDAEHFVNTALIDHPPDLHGLGIRLSQLGVTDIIPEGELKKAAELKAIEQQERNGEEYDFETERLLVHAYLEDANKGLPDGDSRRMTYQQALENVQTNRRRMTKVKVESSGNPILDAVALLGAQRQTT